MSQVTSEILRGANLYSIEYTGIFILKFSLSQDSLYYNSFANVLIEYVSGCVVSDSEKEFIPLDVHTLNMIGADVTDSSISEENILRISFENGYSVCSVAVKDDLLDRNWIIRTESSDYFIINDGYRLFDSNNFHSDRDFVK